MHVAFQEKGSSDSGQHFLREIIFGQALRGAEDTQEEDNAWPVLPTSLPLHLEQQHGNAGPGLNEPNSEAWPKNLPAIPTGQAKREGLCIKAEHHTFMSWWQAESHSLEQYS